MFAFPPFPGRPRDYTLGPGGLTPRCGEMAIEDAKFLLMPGDILEIATDGEYERVEVLDPAPESHPGLFPIRRARDGTRAAYHFAGDTVRLVGNRRANFIDPG